VWPESGGVSDETQDVGRGLDGERFHEPSPSATGRHRMCLSDARDLKPTKPARFEVS
jgi:hypothetical protein